MGDEGLRRGPLHDLHARLGARFVGFSGYEMPVMYTGIKEEHARVRQAVGLFDVSHMSNLRITGPGAEALLTFSTPARTDKLGVGKGVYTVILDDSGRIIDDTIVYRLDDQEYYMVPNAGMNDAVRERLEKNTGSIEAKADIRDETEETYIFALQGPNAGHVMEALGLAIAENPRFAAHRAHILGTDLIVTTTGYTGESGYELFVPVSHGPKLFEALLKAGKDHDIAPCGLGARDTLRLEMGYALAGHEFKGGRTPLEAGLGWTVKWDHDFVGKDALVVQKESGDHERLVGIEVTGRGIPREGHPVSDMKGRRIGIVTSGTHSPSLDRGIALAYVPPTHTKAGTEVQVDVRGRGVDAVVVRPPFLKK